VLASVLESVLELALASVLESVLESAPASVLESVLELALVSVLESVPSHRPTQPSSQGTWPKFPRLQFARIRFWNRSQRRNC